MNDEITQEQRVRLLSLLLLENAQLKQRIEKLEEKFSQLDSAVVELINEASDRNYS